MDLPLSIDNVYYYNESFVGDLIITIGVIYFFPHAVDETKPSKTTLFISGAIEHGGLIGLSDLILNFARRQLGSVNQSRLREGGWWREFDTGEQLQSRLDGYVRALKQKQPPAEFSASLPAPLRLTPAEVIKLSTTFMGKLVVETDYDKHDFYIGLKRKKLTMQALTKGGFFGG